MTEATEEDKTRAIVENIQRKAKALIDALHELDGSRPGSTMFLHGRLAEAREQVETAAWMAREFAGRK